MVTKKKVTKQARKTKVEKKTVGPQFQEKRGAIWKKKTKKGDAMLSIVIDEKNFFGFINRRKNDAKGKVRLGMEKMPDYFLSQFEKIKGKDYQIDCGGVWQGASKNGKIKDMLWILMEQKFIALPNPFKMEDKHPDYVIYLAYSNLGGSPAWRTLGKRRLVGKSVK